MSRLAIAFVLALASVAANAQDTKSEQSQTPGVASGNGLRPFLFDGRMPGDGSRGRQGSFADDRRPNAGAMVVPPKESPLSADDSPHLAGTGSIRSMLREALEPDIAYGPILCRTSKPSNCG